MRYVLVCLYVCFMFGCGSGSRHDDGLYETAAIDEEKEKVIKAHINALKQFRLAIMHERANDIEQEVEASKNYEEAKMSLVKEGVRIESYVLEALTSSSDWGIRYGAIDVLDSIMMSNSGMEVLINALTDAESLVRIKALFSLRIMSARETVETGQGDIPPEPVGGQEDWERYLMDHGQALQDAWRVWWAENKGGFSLK